MPTREQKLGYKKTYREKHKEEIREYKREYRRTHKEKNRIYNREKLLLKKYNLTLAQYNEMFIKQEYKCAICGKHQSEYKRTFDVDHDHCTEKVRGLLCGKCNRMLGNVNDDINILINAINYLKSFSQ